MDLKDISNKELEKLAETSSTNRDEIDLEELQGNIKQLASKIESDLQRIYDLMLLEAQIHCDSFHKAKRSLSKVGEPYGYISSNVRRDSGTNSMRFYYRIITNTGYVIRKNIRMSGSGYNLNSFKKTPTEMEREIALMTEEEYSKLRNDGKKIKAAMRKIRSVVNTYKN